MRALMRVLAVCIPLLGGCAGVATQGESPGVTRSEHPGVMRGMYSYMADAALFKDCKSGKSMPVATVADNLALERAYLQERHDPGQALLVTLEGRVESRMPMEGAGPVDTLIPERFIGIQSGKDCSADLTSPGLVNTYWKLTYLGDAKAVHFQGGREPHIVLHPDNRVTGSDGCNLLSGAFRLDQDHLSFARTASTMMACPQGLEQEQQFNSVLLSATSYRILNEYLELLGEGGSMLARFMAKPSR